MRLMIVAGEASGEKHGADLMKALRARAPDLHFEFFGSGGEAMRGAGAEILVDVRDVSIIGPVEILRGLGRLLTAYRRLRDAALERRPDAVIFIDWPEFNLRLVKAVKRAGLRTIYYISPQLWAWRSGRVRIVRRFVDKMIVILPFEVEFYRRHGIEVEFVGHPLTGTVHASLDRAAFCRRYSLDSDMPLISLLPGSRNSEVNQILPVLIQAAEIVSDRAEAQFIVPLASTISRGTVETIIAASRRTTNPPALKIIEHDTYDSLAHSTLAVVASGTATLEAALLETPLIVVYRGLEINWRLIRPLIHLDTFGLVNLVAGQRIAPELIQHDLTPAKLAAEMLGLLTNETRRLQMKQALRRVRALMREGSATERAAAAVAATLAPG